MRYEVPQFIDVQDKIFGPLTLPQFLYLVGAGGGAYLSYNFFPVPVNLLVAVAFACAGLALAFVKVNGRPLISMVEAFFYYQLGDKLYVWQHQKERKEMDTKTKATKTREADKSILKNTTQENQRLTRTQLRDLAQSLDVKENAF